jgi:V/A-type H+-transporting ATPase subunit I
MLVPMAKVEIVGPRRLFNEVLSTIHEYGYLHIDDMSGLISQGDMFVHHINLSKEDQEKRQKLRQLVSRLDATIKAISQKIPTKEDRGKFSLEVWPINVEAAIQEVTNLLEKLESETKELVEEKRGLEFELANLKKYDIILGKIGPLAAEIGDLEGLSSMAILIDKQMSSVLEKISQQLSEVVEDQYQIITDEVDEDTIAALIVFTSKASQKVKELLRTENINEVKLPEKLRKLSIDQAIKQIEKRSKEIPPRIKSIDERLEEMSRNHLSELRAMRMVLKDKLSELEVVGNFAQTDYTFLISGWVPRRYFSSLVRLLLDKFGDQVIARERELSAEDEKNAPIAYKNPKVVRVFEPIVNLFGFPRYGSIDPNPLVAIFFPLFFGVILGDMGYALVLFLIAILLKRVKKSEIFQSLSIIITLMAAFSFVFGAVYGEFFGDLPEIFHLVRPVKIFGLTFPINRGELVVPMLLFTIALGATHIFLGLILGAVGSFRQRAPKHAIEKLALLGTLVSIILILLASIRKIPFIVSPAVVALIVSLILLFWYGKLTGVLEVAGSFANIVSYARLMALGLVSVILADLANNLGGQFGNILIGVTIAILIHAINLTIHVFTPSIHALRLNFVEFYSKFFSAGGKAYKPFKKGGH